MWLYFQHRRCWKIPEHEELYLYTAYQVVSQAQQLQIITCQHVGEIDVYNRARGGHMAGAIRHSPVTQHCEQVVLSLSQHFTNDDSCLTTANHRQPVRIVIPLHFRRMLTTCYLQCHYHIDSV